MSIQESMVNTLRSKLEVPKMCKRAAIPNYCNSSEIATPANANEATTINTTIASTTTFTCIDGFTGQGVHPMKVLLTRTDIDSDYYCRNPQEEYCLTTSAPLAPGTITPASGPRLLAPVFVCQIVLNLDAKNI